jgi:hypothetical protein
MEKELLRESIVNNLAALKGMRVAMGVAEDLENHYQLALSYVQILSQIRRFKELLAELERGPELVQPHGN